MYNKDNSLAMFEKISPYTAKYGNVLFAYERLCDFSFANKKATLFPLVDKKLGELAVIFAIKVENSLWHIGFENSDWLLFHHAIKEKQSLKNIYKDFLPLELQQVLAENIITPLLEQLEEKVHSQIILEKSYLYTINKKELSSSYISCLLQVQDEETSYETVVYFFIPEEVGSIQFLEKIQKILPNIEKNTFVIKNESIMLPLSFCVGETELSLAEIKNLEQGDLILFDTYYLKDTFIKIYPHYWQLEKTNAFNFNENQHILCTLKENLIYVKEWVKTKHKGFSMEQNDNKEDIKDNETSSLSSAMGLSSMGLSIHFELEQRMISLQELQAIKPGYTFALNVDLLAPVNLVVQGNTIGKGKIVDINGVLGVQVIEFYNK